jgi:hypothetical protein
MQAKSRSWQWQVWSIGLIASCVLDAFGAQYHVAPSGTAAGDGSKDKPFSAAHVAQAVTLQPGDEVVFRDGVYTPALLGGPLNIQSIGSARAPITWRAENRHQAIIDGGRPIAGWQAVAGEAGVWEHRLDFAPRSLLVDGEGLIDAGSTWRRDGRTTLDEGMFAVQPQTDKRFLVRLHNWMDRAPQEVFAVDGTLVNVAGAFNVFDGFVVRRGLVGVHVAGRQVHVYQPEGQALEVSGLAHNAFGCFNVVRRCIVRDMTGQGLTSNESRFNTIEDCVIYNAGVGQGDHGIYVSNGAENLTLRRNIWWRTSGGAIHIYSGSAIDSPRGIVVQYNIFGPDKRGRCFPLRNRKSAAIYVWGGSRFAGHNRITHNLVIGPHDRALSVHRSHFNLIAHNVFLNSSGAPLQIGSGYGSLIVNNIIEYSPGGSGDGFQERPEGYAAFSQSGDSPSLTRMRNNLLLPRGDQGGALPAGMEASRVATADPFVNRAQWDFRLKPDSEAIDVGIALEHITGKIAGRAPDAGPLECGMPMHGDQGRFPEVPAWLLKDGTKSDPRPSEP